MSHLMNDDPPARTVRDNIHDFIPWHTLICMFVDTPQFQRLRRIKQLGTSYYVWPGASHNRHEHCLGVAHLARKMVSHLRTAQPELGITARDERCVELAGLCHDLGHGPWSHVWDGVFIPRALPKTEWKHEDASEMMFDDLVTSNGIELNARDSDFIKDLIAGKQISREGRKPQFEKMFLFDIVSNSRNGIDVDKFDYIMRDSVAVQERTPVSLMKVLLSARVIDNQICYDFKDANAVYDLCATRFSLHKNVYSHKTAKAIQHMIVDAMLAADPHLKVAERIFDPKKYIHLTDSIMERIEESTVPELSASRAIFERIHRRDLYRQVDSNKRSWSERDLLLESITPEVIVNAAKRIPRPAVPITGSFSLGDDGELEDWDVLVRDLRPEHVIVDYSELHYGKKDKNPLQFVKFYSKLKPNVCLPADLDNITTLMPAEFGEIFLRIYTRDSRFYAIIQAGYRAVIQTLDALRVPSESETIPRPSTPTPTESGPVDPSTPYMLPSAPPSRTPSLILNKQTSLSQMGSQGSPSVKKPFAPNRFNDIPPNYRPQPTSPTPKKMTVKRAREGEGSEGERENGISLRGGVDRLPPEPPSPTPASKRVKTS